MSAIGRTNRHDACGVHGLPPRLDAGEPCRLLGKKQAAHNGAAWQKVKRGIEAR